MTFSIVDAEFGTYMSNENEARIIFEVEDDDNAITIEEYMKSDEFQQLNETERNEFLSTIDELWVEDKAKNPTKEFQKPSSKMKNDKRLRSSLRKCYFSRFFLIFSWKTI